MRYLLLAVVPFCGVGLLAPASVPERPAVRAPAIEKRAEPVVMVIYADEPKKKDDAPYIKLPATLKATPNRYFRLHADSNCKNLRWVLPAGLDDSLSDILKDPTTKLLVGDAGTYTVTVQGTLGDVFAPDAVCTVTIGQPPPPPPPPPPPGPTDPFAQALAAAYAKEADPGKAGQVAFLTSLYQGAGSLLGPDTATAGALFSKLSAAIHAPGVGLPQGALPQVSKVIGADLNGLFGVPAPVPANTPTPPADTLKKAFAKYAAALGGLK